MNHGLNRAHLLAVLLCVVPCAAIAANLSPVQKEIATAKIHATVAAHAESLKMAQLHLHHVINCMVGEHGSGYSAAAEALAAVPCTGLGKGAIADSSGDPPVHSLMEGALRAAQAGTKADTLSRVKKDATRVLALLDKAEPAQPKPSI